MEGKQCFDFFRVMVVRSLEEFRAKNLVKTHNASQVDTQNVINNTLYVHQAIRKQHVADKLIRNS